MFLDLLCDNNYINVSIKFMKIVGTETAVYFAELLNIIREVVRKKKYNEQGFFKVDRKYVEDRTTLTKEEQYDCDVILTKLLILSASPEDLDVVRVDLEEYAKILVDDNMKCIKSEKKKLKVTTADRTQQKRAGMATTFRKIVEGYELPENLTKALSDWTDTIIIAVARPINKVIVNTFIEKVMGYSTNDAVRLEIISQATVNGWTNADWAINSYLRNVRQGSTSAISLPEQKVSQGLSTDPF